MVTRSIDNWKKHKQDVYTLLKKRIQEKSAKKFIKYYSNKYDKFNRSFIDYKLAFVLMDEIEAVHKIGTKFYACFGTGGVGKTTLMKNILYFCDSEFKSTLIPNDVRSFVKVLAKLPLNKSRACGMDEPDDQYSPQSVEGKVFRKILGKCRQHKLIIGFCATDLKDLPLYFFRKLNGIFFIPSQGRGMFFRDDPDKKSYIVQEIRDKFSQFGYQVFWMMEKRPGVIKFNTMAATPFDNTKDHVRYLKYKEDDYKANISDALKMMNSKKSNDTLIPAKDQIVLNNLKKGLTNKEIARFMGFDPTRVTQIKKKYKDFLNE